MIDQLLDQILAGMALIEGRGDQPQAIHIGEAEAELMGMQPASFQGSEIFGLPVIVSSDMRGIVVV